MGFMLAPIQSRVTIPLFRPASPFEDRSTSFSLAPPFSSVLHIPFNSLSTPPSHPFPLPHHLYIARKFRTPQTRGSSRISRESEFLPAAPPFLAFSLRPFFPPSFRLWHPSALSGFLRRLSYPPDIYLRVFPCISFQLVPSHTHLVSPSFSFSSSSSSFSPSSFCSLWFRESTFERSVSLSPLYLFLSSSRHTRSSRSFCSVPFHHRCRVVVPSLTPFVARPSSPRLFALLYRAALPPVLTPPPPHPCSCRDSIGLYPRSLAARSPTVSSSVRRTFLSISPAGGTGGRGEEGSLLQVVPASDRRRCRVSRNRSPPMPRGGRTVALAVYYRYYDYYYYYFRRDQYFLFLYFFFSRGIVCILIRGK